MEQTEIRPLTKPNPFNKSGMHDHSMGIYLCMGAKYDCFKGCFSNLCNHENV